ncbi:flagellar brake protein [Shewanella youngdeokensis]|uniref:PilZ domain-containing protein n=1 Tax=Shewanella youngdeokensis TaxID=2999068 RepID=A0ABZ0JZ66_9GAMM|nr:PilZ domain-containing protein [Shewanella sp. DAU334]
MPNEHSLNALDSLTCNTEVHLQILTPTQAIRLRTKLIGVDPGRALILAHGHDKAWAIAAPFIRDKQSVIMRVVNSDEHDANILAFRTRIQSTITLVGRWLIIDYPNSLQTVALRQHSRIPVKVLAKLVTSRDKQVISHGELRDISIKGGAFVGEAIADLEVDSELTLQLKLDDQSETTEAVAVVKNQQDLEAKTGQSQYGLTWKNETDATEKMVQKVILHHLLQQPKNDKNT